MANFNFLNTGYLFEKIYEFFSGVYFIPLGGSLSRLLDAIRVPAVILCIILIVGIFYCTERIRELRSHGDEEAEELAVAEEVRREPVRNERWKKILEHVNSPNASDWRLAILECDVVLEEMLEKMAYHGETLSDKLKAVERSDFTTIDKAWEGHRVRNMIAHEGSSFELNQREAIRVVALFEDVFKEFHYI